MFTYILTALITIVLTSKQLVFASELIPPTTNITNPSSSIGTTINPEWNYIKIETSGCNTKNILNELQADGGVALKATDLWTLENNTWINHTFEDLSEIDPGQVIAFNSNTKFYFDLGETSCKPDEYNQREQQIEQVRQTNLNTEGKGTFVSGIIEKIGSVFDFKKDDLEEKGTFDTDKAVNIKSTLNVIGDTTLWNTVITGAFKIGQMSLNSLTNSIEINGPQCSSDNGLCEAQTLYLQKNLAGNVDVFDGKIQLLENGDIKVQGTIESTKVLTDEYSVKGTSRTIGEGIMTANTTEIVIDSNMVKETSKIFITATNDTYGQTMFVKEKVEGTSFTVGISNSVETDIEFDWFIVNVD